MATEFLMGSVNIFGNMMTIGKIIFWFFAFAILAASIITIMVLVMMKAQQTKVVELNMVNKKVRFFGGRYKKRKKEGARQFWASKLKRFLPNFQQKDIYLKGKKELILLLKDNNGLYHTARVPTWKELKKWYKVVYDINLEDKDKLTILHEKLRNVYLLPSPHEDLDWLANQIVEADREFMIDHWWQSPAFVYIGVGFICFLMLMGTIILTQKL